jgi:putative ABC transport system permease protein
MSYSVSRRTSEIGIRLALGAEPRAVLTAVLFEAISIVTTGIAVGIVAVIAAAPLIKTLLYGLAPHDPASLLAAALLMFIASLVAAYWPARRASRCDPMVALRYE